MGGSSQTVSQRRAQTQTTLQLQQRRTPTHLLLCCTYAALSSIPSLTSLRHCLQRRGSCSLFAVLGGMRALLPLC